MLILRGAAINCTEAVGDLLAHNRGKFIEINGFQQLFDAIF